MLTVSRRGLLALGGAGAAGTVLSACGEPDDPREDGRDAELLAAERDAETAVQVAASAAAGQGSGKEVEVTANIAEASSRRAEELQTLAEDAGAPAAEGGGSTTRSVSQALDDALAAHREAAGLLSTEELRADAMGFMVEAAAEQAALSLSAGEDPVPYAFVTGLSEQPLEASSQDTTTTTESTTTKSETTTTTTEGDGP